MYKMLSWFSPSQQWSTAQSLAHNQFPILSRTGEGIRKAEVINFMGWNKGYLMGQKGEKVIITILTNYNNTNKRISTYKTSDAQCNCSPPTYQSPAISQAAAHGQFPPPVYIVSMMVCGLEYHFGQLGSAALPVCPHNLLCSSSPATGRA